MFDSRISGQTFSFIVKPMRPGSRRPRAWEGDEPCAVIAMVPCVVLYLALQRYYVQGLTSGAVKG